MDFGHIERPRAHVNLDRAVVRRELERVSDQVREYLSQTMLIDRHFGKNQALERGLEMDISQLGLSPEALDRIAHDLEKIVRLELQRESSAVHSRGVEQILDQLLHLRDRLENLIGRLLVSRAREELHLQR